MSFPQTRLTLIQRIVSEGNRDDWHTFVCDYWGPVCRFALRWGATHMDDAEDVAVETFEVLWRNDLLVRWIANRSARLRTLLCTVVRNNLGNRGRVRAARQRILNELLEELEHQPRPENEGDDVFYGAWVEDLIERAVQSLAADYGRQGKGDYLRVLYGRICEGLTIAQCGAALGLTSANVDNYFRHARNRLREQLLDLLRQQTARYVLSEGLDEELNAEWQKLGAYLTEQGGLDDALRRVYHETEKMNIAGRRERAVSRLRKPKTPE